MAQLHHFIRMKHYNLLYGRVPKAANSSIKAALCRLLSERPPKGTKTTSDKFWQHETNQETELITLRRARRYRVTHFSFSFVRNPFDRLVAAYNNKILEIDDVPQPMKRMGLRHNMPFPQFIETICRCNPDELDNHIRPQADMLLTNGLLVPKFVGRMEHINTHWRRLRRRMKLEGLPTLGKLPRRNVRRKGRSDIADRFNTPALIDTILERYAQDFERFYSFYTVDQLLSGDELEEHAPLQRGAARARARQAVANAS